MGSNNHDDWNIEAARNLVQEWDRDIVRTEGQPLPWWGKVIVATIKTGIDVAAFAVKSGYSVYKHMRYRLAEYRMGKIVSRITGYPTRVKIYGGSVRMIAQAERIIKENSQNVDNSER